MTRLLGLVLLLSFSATRGGSLGPSDPDGLTLRGFEVDAVGVSARRAPPFLYSACGTVDMAQRVYDGVTVEKFEVIIRNEDGRDFLTWSALGYPTVHSGPVLGCFGGPLDSDPTRPPGTSFRVRVTYTRHGGRRVVEASGPITSR
jgi:hypothetical protein